MVTGVRKEAQFAVAFKVEEDKFQHVRTGRDIETEKNFLERRFAETKYQSLGPAIPLHD